MRITYDPGMTFEELLAALSTPAGPTDRTLRAAVAYSRGLSPIVRNGLSRRRSGIPFTDVTRNRTLYGLYACAAARERDLWSEWIAFLRVDRNVFEDLFGLLDEYAVARLTLCLIDANDPKQIDMLFQLLEEKSHWWAVRYGLWLVLARLTGDGSVDVARTIALVEAYPKMHVTPGADYSLYGWLFAIILLGWVDLMPEIADQWATAPLFEKMGDEDRELFRDQLLASYSNEGFWMYEQMGIAPFDDPVEGMTRPTRLPIAA